MRSSTQIYADILKRGILAVRGASSLDDAREHACHIHNLPGLLLAPEHQGLHDYYWRIERVEFIQKLGRQKAQVFDDLWSELGAAREIETGTMK